MKKIVLFIAALFCFQSMHASHAAGGEIWYVHDTLNTYEINFRLYRDCSGIPSPASVSLGYSSVSSSFATQILNMPQVANYPYNVCANNTCINPSSPAPGTDIAEYKAVLTLPNAASDWTFKVAIGARNPSTNLVGTGNLFIEAILDNLNTPFNNSPVPYTPLNMLQYFNTQTTFNFPTLDVDGDSLDIQFTQPMNSTIQATTPSFCTWQTGYSLTNPFGSTTPPLLNSSNGNLTLFPSNSGGMSFAVKIDEYRSGVLIGSAIRDYLFFYAANNTNSMPALSGVNNTNSFVTNIDICPNSTLNFTLNSSDPDANDTTTISSIYIPPGATFTTNNAQNQVGTFTWSPTAADVQSQAHIISFKVKDNSCSEQSFGYQIFVNQCNPDSVWAGDANADFICNNYDILNIGLGNGSTGAVRTGATTLWQAEWCANWTNSFVSNINYKHADCNGDGTINNLDMASITANYGQIHQKTSRIGQYKTLGLPDLYCDMQNIQAHSGSTVSIPVMFGTSSSLVNDFYGISATVELLNAQTAAPISMTKNVSWIGNANNSFEFDHSLAPNKTAFTFVRNDQQNLYAQQGQIGEILFPIDASSMVGSQVIAQFSDIKMIKNNGEEITDYNVLSDSLVVLAPNAVADLSKELGVKVYPNPTNAKTTIRLRSDKTDDYKITLVDLVGRTIQNDVFNGKLDAGEHSIKLNMSDLAQGAYLLEILSTQGKMSIPVQKQ